MRSVLTSAVLATALCGQAFARASPHRHGHQHLHAKKHEEIIQQRAVGSEVIATIDGAVVSWVNEYSGGAATTAATTAAAATTTTAAVEKELIAASKSTASSSAAATSVAATVDSVLSDAATVVSNMLEENSILAAVPVSGISVGTGGTFEMAVTNSAEEDIVLVFWTSVSTQWVTKTAPVLTVAIGCNETQSVSFDSDYFPVHGAFSILSSVASMKSVDGSIYNTWGEFGFVNDQYSSSTVDVSGIIRTDGGVSNTGNGLSMTTYTSKDSSDAVCVTEITPNSQSCYYQWTSGEAGAITDSPTCQDTYKTTFNSAGTDGGCAFGAESGYVAVTVLPGL